MKLITKGRLPHSYVLNIFGLRIKFRNKFVLKNNKFIVVGVDGKEVRKSVKGLKIVFLGENSTVKVYSPCSKFRNTTIFCGDNASVVIEASTKNIYNLTAHVTSDGASLNIGKDVKIRGGSIVIKDSQNLSVNIGERCLIANGVKIRTTDFHTVFDNETKQPLNPPQSVNIGKHCWICENATIAKSVSIPDNTIVAAHSYVTKSFDKPNTIIGGIPAKIIKDQNTNWTEMPYEEYKDTLI